MKSFLFTGIFLSIFYQPQAQALSITEIPSANEGGLQCQITTEPYIPMEGAVLYRLEGLRAGGVLRDRYRLSLPYTGGDDDLSRYQLTGGADWLRSVYDKTVETVENGGYYGPRKVTRRTLVQARFTQKDDVISLDGKYEVFRSSYGYDLANDSFSSTPWSVETQFPFSGKCLAWWHPQAEKSPYEILQARFENARENLDFSQLPELGKNKFKQCVYFENHEPREMKRGQLGRIQKGYGEAGPILEGHKDYFVLGPYIDQIPHARIYLDAISESNKVEVGTRMYTGYQGRWDSYHIKVHLSPEGFLLMHSEWTNNRYNSAYGYCF